MRLFRWAGACCSYVTSGFASYFFGAGDFALSHALCRIAIGYCLWHLLGQVTQADWSVYLAGFDHGRYRPVGILTLLGRGVPAPEFFWACQWIATISIWAIMLGFCTRISFVTGTISMLFLTSLPWSFHHGWGHHQTAILLAAVAMMFAGSSPLSLDAVMGWAWRWFRGTASDAPVSAGGHRWPVVLGQFAVALMFTNACFWKLYQPGEPFAVWALSDNMYHMLHYQYWALDRPLPSGLDWAVSHEWSYKLLAVGNLVTQALPCLACFLINRPRLRVLAGVAMLVETWAIGAVMQLHNPIWFLLFVFFVDWDRFFAWAQTKATFRSQPAQASVSPAGLVAAWTWRAKLAAAWVVLFMACYLGVAFAKKTQSLYTFPFTAWGMYSDVLSPRPYDQHLAVTLHGSTWSVDAATPVTKGALRGIWINHHNLPWHAKWDYRCQVLKTVAAQTNATRVTLAKTSFQIMPFPAKEVRPVQSAISCMLDGGRFKGLETTNGWDAKRGQYYVEVTPHGFDHPRLRFGYYFDKIQPWQPLEVEQVGDRYYYEKPTPGVYWLVALVQDGSPGAEEQAFDAGVFRK